MTEKERKNTCYNTAQFLKLVRYPLIQVHFSVSSLTPWAFIPESGADILVKKKYLAQIYNVAPEWSQGVYDMLPKKEFKFSEVEKLSQNTQEWYKEKKFRPSQGDRLVGYTPSKAVYNV